MRLSNIIEEERAKVAALQRVVDALGEWHNGEIDGYQLSDTYENLVSP